MKRSALILIVLAAGASAAVPVLEQQYYASIKHSEFHDGVLYSEVDYDTYNDAPNKRYRQDFSTAQGNNTAVADYTTNVFFIIRNGVCTLMPPPSQPPAAAQTVDPRSVDAGPTTVSGGQAAELWSAKFVDTSPWPTNHTLDSAVQTTPAAGRLPVRLLVSDTFHQGTPGRTGEPGCDCKPLPCTLRPCLRKSQFDYSNGLHVGPMPDSLFAQPAGCKPRGELTDLEGAAFKWFHGVL